MTDRGDVSILFANMALFSCVRVVSFSFAFGVFVLYPAFVTAILECLTLCVRLCHPFPALRKALLNIGSCLDKCVIRVCKVGTVSSILSAETKTRNTQPALVSA